MNPWIRFNLICQFSKDSFRGFDLRCGFQKILVADSICGAVFKRFDLLIRSWCCFQKIRRILTKPANPQESLVHRRTLDKRILNFWIRESVSSSKDLFRGFVSWCGSQKIRFADSIRDAVFKRFDSRICFAKKKFQNYLIRFDSEGFVYDSHILTKLPLFKHNLFLDFVQIISGFTRFVGQNCWTKSESNIPNFDGCRTKGLWFELWISQVKHPTCLHYLIILSKNKEWWNLSRISLTKM